MSDLIDETYTKIHGELRAYGHGEVKGIVYPLIEALEAAEAERDAATAAVEQIREAVSGHPECDRYSEDDVISCGWKSAYASVVAALAGAPEPEVAEAETGVRPWADRFRYAGSDAGNGVLARGFERAKAERERQARLDVLRGQSTDEIVNGLQLPVEGEKP